MKAAVIREVEKIGIEDVPTHTVEVGEGEPDTVARVLDITGNTSLTATVPVFPLIYQKRLTGTVNGSISPHIDIPAALEAFVAGRFPLDRLITRTYQLDQVDNALGDLHGSPGRGVIVF